MGHPTSNYEAIMDCIVQIREHGFIRLVDIMGSDSRIAQAARVSYGGESRGTIEDRRLIRYMARHGHTSPFEHVVLTFHVKCPIFVARQWQRHRTWSYNEISARYTELPSEYFLPEAEEIVDGSITNRQGRSVETVKDAEYIRQNMRDSNQHANSLYNANLNNGVAKEIARTVLPVAQYTEFYATVNLHNLFHFLKLRTDSHAQLEIREYAEAIIVLLEQTYKIPYALEAFQDYIQDAVTLSVDEWNEVRDRIGIIKSGETHLTKSEELEFLEKIGGTNEA